MKIGILTQPLSNNYGGILQNWALQQILKQLGHEPITLNIPRHKLNEKKEMSRTCWRFLKRLRGDNNILFLNAKKQLNFLNTPGKFQLDFINENINVINMNGPIQSGFYQEHGDIGAFVVGSDQVWRKAFSPCLANYFLDFVEHHDVKRIGYAISFGQSKMDVSAEEIKVFKRLAKKFDAISVREDEGTEICSKQLEVSAEWVLDPTMLLYKNDYLKFVEEEYPRPYVAIYVLDNNSTLKKVITDFCNQKKLTPLYIGKPSRKGFPSIQSWIGGIANAEYVLTDSYHGTLFSLIFHKQFYTFCNKGRGADRFITILGKLGLINRLNMIDSKQITDVEDIDFFKLESEFEILKKRSVDFLEKSLSNG